MFSYVPPQPQLSKRLDIRDEIVDLFICKAVGWHKLCFEACYDLGLRCFNGFMDIGFIRCYNAITRYLHLRVKQTIPGRTDSGRAVDRVTSTTSAGSDQQLTGSFRCSCQLLSLFELG